MGSKKELLRDLTKNGMVNRTVWYGSSEEQKHIFICTCFHDGQVVVDLEVESKEHEVKYFEKFEDALEYYESI